MFGEGECTYGVHWRVHESSSAFASRLWLFVHQPNDSPEESRALHLDTVQATALRDALTAWLESPTTRPDPDDDEDDWEEVEHA